MFDATPSSTKPGLMVVFLAVLRRLLRLQPRPAAHPMLLPAVLAQAHRQRTVHQLLQLRQLAACWLAAPERRLLEQHLQRRVLAMAANRPPSPKSTSSSGKTGRRTGKRRR